MDVGFSILLLDLLPLLYIYGAVSSFRRLRAALWPAGFPVYASAMTFPHPSAALRRASRFMLLSRCLPRGSNGLAVMSATLGSYNWLGFITYGLSPYKKRLALLGAQQHLFVVSRRVISGGGYWGSTHDKPLRNKEIFFKRCVYQDDSCHVQEQPGAWLISRYCGNIFEIRSRPASP